MTNHDVLTVRDVAEYLKIDKRTVYKLAKEGKIPCSKIGRQWRFSRKQIMELISRPTTIN
ncbi:MAG: DNA-binding protein [Deltaproteobacteria bacterium]|nr:MAG: DNA-binding protein [Deltaproteobacteria bacterium]RME53746.1 MAG: DNA-binding protein [Deltaproteobacteria bacterium]